eukprot:TRINITY_DN14066_c0_g1_i1.p1 TRINITY_DN14066_c0_g1~~TRINITY_DN14066_c0_g1_i1.p1  ORF type:complete len:431 (+),score=95.99 TRINITY_DN14066_c0_g1_i1:78-1370(+)
MSLAAGSPGTSETTTSSMWSLEEHGDSDWRLKVVVPDVPQVDLSADSLRMTLAGVEPSTFRIPEHAQPVDTTKARCSFSRKRGELVIEWPRVRDDFKASIAPSAAVAATDANENVGSVVGHVAAVSAHANVAPTEPTIASSGRETARDIKVNRNGAVVADPAIASLKESAKSVPQVTAEEWRTRGNEAVKVGGFEEAIRCYTAGIAVGGGDEAMIRSNRAMILNKLGRYEEAVEDARCCVSLRPDFFKGYLRGAVALRALGRPAEALAFVKRCPPHEEAGKLVAELKPEAEEAEKKRIASLGGAERAKEEGNVLFRKGSFEAALVQYTKAIDLCEDPAGALALALRNNRAACNHQLSDYSAVVADTSFVLDHEPANIKALTRRMLALEPLERFKAALEDAREVLRQDPRNEIANKVQHRVGQQVRKMDVS